MTASILHPARIPCYTEGTDVKRVAVLDYNKINKTKAG